MDSRYPANWSKLSLQVRDRANYCCDRCGRECIPPGVGYRNLPDRVRRAFTAQVHHRDFNPANNNLDNLVCLCAPCHLSYHQGNSSVAPGQLSLKLRVKKNLPKPVKKRFRQIDFSLWLTPIKVNNIQLTLDLRFDKVDFV